jgi:LDH2 family malate/lactate/ureidoglycolate dehydrogenase
MKIKELESILIQKASEIVPKEEAEYFAKESIETHIRKTPRANPLKSTIADLIASLENSTKEIEYTVNLDSYFAIDFKSHGPLIYIKRIHDELEKKSLKTGVAMVSFQNSKSMHTLHSWVQGLAKRGLLAIAICNGGPNAVVPFNGHKGIFGTNPMAYGFSDTEGKIYCVDMATSEAPYFEIMDAYSQKKKMREGIAVNGKGEPTLDPEQAIDFSVSKTDPRSNLLSMGGGYKGYYLVFLMELMTSALIGMPSSPEMNPNFVPEEHGATILVFNPKAMNTATSFNKSVEILKMAILEQAKESEKEIRFPGENNNRKFENFDSDEVELNSAVLDKLKKLGE